MSSPAQNPSHFSHLEAWLRSYDPASLFDDEGALMPELKGECLKKNMILYFQRFVQGGFY